MSASKAITSRMWIQAPRFTAKPKMAKVEMAPEHQVTSPQATVLTYKPAAKRAVMRTLKVGRPRQAVAAAR